MIGDVYTKRDVNLAQKAKQNGAEFSLRIVMEARRAGLPISLGFALIEKESDFRNVFGHDPTSSVPKRWMGTTVTRAKYTYYKVRRKLGLGMQGVGPAQLTWYETQDKADAAGGCWRPEVNIRVAFSTLAYLIDNFGLADGCRRYNGSSDAAVIYSANLRIRARKWHAILSTVN